MQRILSLVPQERFCHLHLTTKIGFRMIVIMLSFGNDESKTIQALIFYQKEIFILAAIKRIKYRIEHSLILVVIEWKILKI